MKLFLRGLGEQGPLRRLSVLLCILLGWGSAAAGPEAPAPQGPEGIEWVTRPSKDIMLSFVRPGLVKEILVKEGDWVKAGQVLIQLDDAAERMQLQQFKDEAEDKTHILAAEAEHAQKGVDLKKFERAGISGAATPLEVEHARLDVLIAKLRLQLARFQQKLNQLKYKEAELLVARMRLVSPIDGRVERVAVKVGEGVEALARIVRMVKIDPLWIDVPAPLAQARTELKVGVSASVAFTDPGGKCKFVQGKIVLIDSVADAASDTLNVRVEVPNPSHRPAGEHVRVTFPPGRKAGKENSVQEVAAITPQRKAKTKE